MRLRDRLRQSSGTWTVLLALALLAPTVISYAPYTPEWDDSYYMHRALAFNRALWEGDSDGIRDCLRQTFKSPVATFLAVPWGPLASGTAGPGLLFLSLAVAEWMFVFVSLWMLRRCSVSPWALVIGTICVAGNRFVLSQAGELLLDPLLSWIVLATLLLIGLEGNRAEDRGVRPNVRRGALWGVIFCAGLLCKASYLYFLALTLPVLLALRWRRHGIRSAATALLTSAVICSPALLLWSRFGTVYFQHGIASGWGGLSKMYSAADPSWFAFWSRLIDAAGYIVFLIVPFAVFALGRGIASRQRWHVFAPAAILVGYLLIVSTGHNALIRLLLPAMIGLPYAIALLWRTDTPAAIGRLPVALAACALLLACIPETGRPRLGAVECLRDLFAALQADGARRIELATDGPATMNIELARLGSGLMQNADPALEINTVVYDDFNKRPLEQSLRVLDRADAVLFEYPLPQVPTFTNSRAAEYLRHVQSANFRVDTANECGVRVYLRR